MTSIHSNTIDLVEVFRGGGTYFSMVPWDVVGMVQGFLDKKQFYIYDQFGMYCRHDFVSSFENLKLCTYLVDHVGMGLDFIVIAIDEKIYVTGSNERNSFKLDKDIENSDLYDSKRQILKQFILYHIFDKPVKKILCVNAYTLILLKNADLYTFGDYSETCFDPRAYVQYNDITKIDSDVIDFNFDKLKNIIYYIKNNQLYFYGKSDGYIYGKRVVIEFDNVTKLYNETIFMNNNILYDIALDINHGGYYTNKLIHPVDINGNKLYDKQMVNDLIIISNGKLYEFRKHPDNAYALIDHKLNHNIDNIYLVNTIYIFIINEKIYKLKKQHTALSDRTKLSTNPDDEYIKIQPKSIYTIKLIKKYSKLPPVKTIVQSPVYSNFAIILK